ncbi:MAG: type II secretion system secretin GspD, partial [bacterium]|nr:type II secretion system secretin GspD [bacterium]
MVLTLQGIRATMCACAVLIGAVAGGWVAGPRAAAQDAEGVKASTADVGASDRKVATEVPRPTPAGPRRNAVKPAPADRVSTPPPSARPAATNRIPATPNLPMVSDEAIQAEAGQPLFLDFQETDLLLVIKAIGVATGKNFNLDPTIATQKVTVVSNEPVPPELAYEVLEAIVASKGAQLIPNVDGHIVDVVPVGKGFEKADTVTDIETPPVGYDRLHTYIVGVKHADATELSTILKTLGSENSRADAYGVTNTLILTDTASGINNMLEFLREVDVPGFDEVMEIFPLKYARAEVLATQVQDVLLGPEGEGSAVPTAQSVRQAVVRPGRAAPPSMKNQTIVGQRHESLRLVADERLNAVIVVATEGIMERVRDLIDRLDTHTPVESQNIHVYHLLNADAEKVEEALSGFFESTTPRQGGSGQGGGAQAGPSGEVQPFEKEVSITRYDQTNALLILAAPQDYKVIETIIAKLDVPPRQVHVEALIVQVSINDTFELSVETAGLTANDAFTLNNVVQLANVLNGNIIGADGPAASSVLAFGLLDGTTQITTPDGAGGLVVQQVPNVPLLLTALENLTALDVLSRPSLSTVDNEEAKILIGQDVPIISGSSRAQDQSAIGASVYNRVDREDIGIKMTVTPQINEGDFVFLDLAVEVSALAPASSTVGDPNLLGPTLNKTEIEDKVVIRDGATGIIGGLISENMSRTRTHTPFLGDLPLIGWLFGSRNETRRKEDRVVFVTPHIV